TVATLNGEMIQDGNTPTLVRVFWGPVDGGTVPGLWSHVETFPGFPGVGLIATNLTGLAPDSTYYYRYYASNTWGTSWAASSVDFTTPAGITNPIGLNFVGSGVTMATPDVAGLALPQADWNNLIGAGGTLNGVADGLGNIITSIVVNWSFDALDDTDNTGNGDERMMDGLVLNTAANGNDATVTLENIPAEFYHLYAYVGSSNPDSRGIIRLNGQPAYSFTTHAQSRNFPDDYLQTYDAAVNHPDANVAVWYNLSGSTVTLTLSRIQDCGLHGIQIVPGPLGISTDPVAVNFNGNSGDYMEISEAAGAIDTMQRWNNLPGNAGSAEHPNNVLGHGTPLRIEWNFDGVGNVANGVGSTGNDALMDGHVVNGGIGTTSTLTIANIPLFTFDLHVYFGGLIPGLQGRVDIGGDSRSFGSDTFNKIYPADFVPSTDTGLGYPNANYAVWSNLTASSVTLTHTHDSAPFNTGIMGFQLMPTGTRVDLELTKTASTTNLLFGTNIVYTIAITNLGTAGADNLVVTDTLPLEVAYLTAEPPPTSTNGNDYVFLLGSLAAGASTGIVISTTYTSALQTVFFNAATVAT
ncbi:MAG: DUF11 domain-containing protein, partial [Verrucomicrobiota bacterium]